MDLPVWNWLLEQTCVVWLGGGEKACLKVIKLIGTRSYMSVITTLIDPTAEDSFAFSR